MKSPNSRERILPRGRIATWSREQLEKLPTPDLRALLLNAERLNEPEVAALCNEILDQRPRGRAPVRRPKGAGVASKKAPAQAVAGSVE